MKYQKTKIIKISSVAEGYALLQFKGAFPISGEAGQFVMIRGSWGTDPVLPRAFSLVESGEYGSVLVRDVGKGTSLLCNMKEGDDLFVLGALGIPFTLPRKGEVSVLVAGGVGVAPLILLADTLKKVDDPPFFVYGARAKDDLVLLDKIESLSNLTVATEDGSAGSKGLVTLVLEEILDKIYGAGKEAVVYSCGPHPMLNAVGKLAGTYNAVCEVALESPMACGMGTCKGCAIEDSSGNYRYVCTDGPVFEAKDVFGGIK